MRIYDPIVDIVDIKPVNMEELTEVITSAEFHPQHCNIFMYSSSKGTIKLADMRASALCDQHAKGRKTLLCRNFVLICFSSVRRGGRPSQQIFFQRDHLFDIRHQVQS